MAKSITEERVSQMFKFRISTNYQGYAFYRLKNVLYHTVNKTQKEI